MNVLIAPDKFKGTLTAMQVCDGIERGFQRTGFKANVQRCPVADGGEGTLEVFLFHSGGAMQEVTVHDPLMRTIKAAYGLSNDGSTAFIEMARASGLELLSVKERNPMKTTSYGTGEMIRDALNKGARKIIIGIGGSATNDAALGAFVALGGKLKDSGGKELFPVGENLQFIHHLDFSTLHPAVQQAEFIAVCDVANPFYGEQGAANVYAPQKGATPEMVKVLDRGLQQVADVIKHMLSIDLQLVKGSGAGGGFAGGVHALLNASLKPGIDVVLDMVNFDKMVQHTDIIITGEGKIDQQTLQGKVVAGVAQRAKANSKPVIAVCGVCQLAQRDWKQLPVEMVFQLVDIASKEKALNNSAEVLEQLASEQLVPYLQQKR